MRAPACVLMSTRLDHRTPSRPMLASNWIDRAGWAAFCIHGRASNVPDNYHAIAGNVEAFVFSAIDA
jgi:hypothetical protein